MMKRWMIFGSMAIAAVLAIGIATSLRAQPGIAGDAGAGGGMRQPNPPPMRPTVKVTDQGIFVIQGGVVLKYDTTSLKLQDKLDLTDKLTATASQKTAQALPVRPQSSGVLMSDDSILLVNGNHFFRIDTATLQVKATATLPAIPMPTPPNAGDMQAGPNAGGGDMKAEDGMRQQGPAGMGPNDGGAQGNMPPGPPPGMQGMQGPTMELHGKTLYLLRGSNLTAIDITDGKTLAQAALPRPDGKKPVEGNNGN